MVSYTDNMTIFEQHVKAALDMFGPLTVPVIVEKLAMREIVVKEPLVRSAIDSLIRAHRIRPGDALDGSEIFVSYGHSH